MQLCQRAGRLVPLLSICAVWVGCASSTVPQPSNFNQNPQVVAVYAVDSARGVLPDVLLFSTAAGDTGRISPTAPPTYGSFRVEFDQPVAGQTVANATDRGTAPGAAASFCSTTTSSPIQLLDVDGGNRVVTSSVCYDATSALGSHPHVLVVPGAGAVTDPTAQPLTCNAFTPEPGGAATKRNVFQPNHKYGIQVKSGVVANAAGKLLTAPTAAGWTGDTFQVTTSGLKILAAGFQDPNTGFFVWLDKPDPGFEKDLAPIPDTFQQPSDSSPFLIVLSEAVSAVPAGAVTLVRTDDGTNPAAGATTRGNLIGDRRVIEVNTGDTFEPSQTYTLTIAATLTGDSGDTLGTAKTYTFTAAPGDISELSTSPGNNALAQSTASTPSVEFSVPVAVAPGSKTPTGTFKLTGPTGAAVPLDTVEADPKANNQIVTLTPTALLTPETPYTITFSGVKVGPQPKRLAGQAIPDGSAQFTTATFRMAIIDDATVDAATAAAGGDTPVNADRRTTIEPVDLKNGGLSVFFNNPAAGVDANSVTVSEVNPTTNATTKIPGYTVVQTDPADPTVYTITLPPGYQQKFGQKYEIRAGTTITNPDSGKALKAEGCTSGDCSDVKSFTTRKVSASIAANPPTPKGGTTPEPTGFTVNFSDPIDPASISPFLATEFKLFKRVGGAIDPTPVPITCAITDPQTVTCTAAAPLGAAPNSFLASAVFLQAATPGQGGPAIVDPTKLDSPAPPGTPRDPSAQFFGSVSKNIFGNCP